MPEPSSSSTSSSSARAPARAALGFATMVAGALALVGLAWLALNLARRDVRIDNGGALHACDFLAFKRELAAATPGERMIFVGLSNVLMSIRADEIGERLGRPALNYGLIANVAPSMVFEAAEQVMRPGDLVVLSLPHWFYERASTLDRQQQVVKDLVFSCPTRAWFELPLRDQLTFLARQDVLQVFESHARMALRASGVELAGFAEPPRVWYLATTENGGTFSRAGDWTGNRRADRRLDRFERIAGSPLRLSDLHVDLRGHEVAALRRFVGTARARGLDIVAVWPAAFVGDAPRGGALDEIRALYASLGVELLGRPEEFFYPVDDFFDSPNHLTWEAASLYSARVAELLSAHEAARSN